MGRHTSNSLSHESSGLLFWIMFFGVMVGSRVHAATDHRIYQTCDDHWDVRYPYLVEVRYTGEPFVDDVAQRNYHKNRHGALITEKAVLTRGHDLDKFPDTQNGEKLHTDLDSCMKGGSNNPCLYVNTRRPMDTDDPDTAYCGQNIIVETATFHPKFGRTGLQYIWDLNRTLTNTQFPFVVLGLSENVKTLDNMTIFPSLVFPSTPLDLMYLLRRVSTIGHSSHLCEYPHYDKLKHWGYYGPYAAPDKTKVNMLDCNQDSRDEEDNRKKNRTICWLSALCPENSHIEGSWEGRKPSDKGYYDVNYKHACWDRLTDAHIYKVSFIVFFGEQWTFVSTASPDPLRESADDKLGSPIVCNGVAVGLISTWNDRGRSRRDAYVGTTLLRAWYWLLNQTAIHRDQYWHRASDDSHILGEKYKFKSKYIKPREYDKSIFELSLNERIINTYSSGPRSQRDFAGSVLFCLVISYRNAIQ